MEKASEAHSISQKQKSFTDPPKFTVKVTDRMCP